MFWSGSLSTVCLKRYQAITELSKMANLLLTTLRAENATTLSTMMFSENCSKPFPAVIAHGYIIIGDPPSYTVKCIKLL